MQTETRKQPLFYQQKRGQALSEYLLIVGIVVVASIGVIGLLSQTIRHRFAQVSEELGANTQGLGQKPTLEKGMTEKKTLKNLFKD